MKEKNSRRSMPCEVHEKKEKKTGDDLKKPKSLRVGRNLTRKRKRCSNRFRPPLIQRKELQEESKRKGGQKNHLPTKKAKGGDCAPPIGRSTSEASDPGETSSGCYIWLEGG